MYEGLYTFYEKSTVEGIKLYSFAQFMYLNLLKLLNFDLPFI